MSSDLTAFVVVANFAATLFMVGLIWFVQIVHYPLFVQVGRDQFPVYHAAHAAATTRVVALPMLSEAMTSVALAWHPPSQNLAVACWVGLGLVVVLWVSTATLQIPNHNRLRTSFDFAAQRSLVSGNWIRTAAWSIRGALMWYVVSRTLVGGACHGS